MSIELVTRVIDGDTFETSSGLPPVRLEGVNAPEKGQPGYSAAKRILEILVGMDRKVRIETRATDKYGRRVADVYWPEDGGHMNSGIRQLIGERPPK